MPIWPPKSKATHKFSTLCSWYRKYSSKSYGLGPSDSPNMSPFTYQRAQRRQVFPIQNVIQLDLKRRNDFSRRPTSGRDTACRMCQLTSAGPYFDRSGWWHGRQKANREPQAGSNGVLVRDGARLRFNAFDVDGHLRRSGDEGDSDVQSTSEFSQSRYLSP